MAPQDLASLVDGLETLARELPQRLNGDAEEEALRMRALDIAANLTKNLQSPYEFLMTQGLGPVENTGVIIAADMDLFNTIANHEGPMKLNDITSSVKGDPVMVQRIVRFLAAHKLVDQVDKETYAANRLTKLMTQDYAVPLIRVFTFCSTAYFAAPKHLQSTNYKLPDNPADCAWQLGFQTDENFWAWLRARPEEALQFNKLMQVPRNRFEDQLVEVYPFEKLFAGSGTADILFVDVGGGLGQQCINLRRSFGTDRGRIILQDLPEVVKGNTIDGVEIMAHDMTQPQPISGAKVYYFRGVCHDHNNEVCRTFLGHIKKVMASDSRLLVHEEYVADINPTDRITRMDLAMMSQYAAMERSESQMTQLLESVGFKILGQHDSGKSVWTIIEASL